MRQNKQTVLPLRPRRFALLLVAVAAFLCLAVVNSERTRAQQPSANNANSAPQKSRPKRLTPLRTSETADGSRATITSDGELNDYSAYRSGDRFIVVVPQAEGASGGGARGRGFEGAQVERRGKDVVYTFKLQPGATARVNQRFNRLDVQFSAPKDSANANVKPTPAPTPAKRTLAEEAGLTKPPANANSNAQPTPDARRNADANANNSNNALTATNTQPTPFASASPNASPLSGVVPSPTLAPTAATPGTEQLAQVQPTSAAPVSITTNTPSNAPTSVGAVVVRNWPWLVAALLAVGIGLLFVSRFSGGRDQSRGLPPAAPSGTKPSTLKETKPAQLKPTSAASAASTIAATKATGATTTAATSAGTATAETPATGTSATGTSATGTSVAGTSDAAIAATSAATAATAANLATSGKQSRKKRKKEAEKAKRLAAANELKAGSANAGTGASADVTTKTKDASVGGGAVAGIIIAGAAGAAASGASKVEESKDAGTKAAETKTAETKAIEAVATETTAAATPAVAFDPERIEVEIKKLLAGESYDESLINATDAGTRQLVSAELMQAIAGRNEERKAHARTAFLKHGYFEEATRALQSAEAPGERAAAARTLGLYGDRSATAHLTAALEDPAADVRRTTVEALAELADPAAVGALEALRWRETSRQVPRALIQRAIEASKAAEEAESTAATAATAESDDDTPTLVTATGAEALTALAATEAPELETKESEAKENEAKENESKEIELSYAETPVAAATSLVAEEFGTETQDAPSLTAPVSETPEASVAIEDAPVAVEDAPVVGIEETSIVEAKAAIDETEVETVETKVVEETKAVELVAPHVEAAPTEDVTAEVETPADTPVEVDLAATLAAKEATLIKAREVQEEAETSESAKATEAASAETVLTKPEAETPPVYHSDFAVGSGKGSAVKDDWIDLDADEHEITIRSIEPVNASPEPPAEPLGPFYAEGATGYAVEATESSAANTMDAPAASPTSRHEEPASLFDSLEVETFETSEITVAESAPEPEPVSASSVDFALVEDAATEPPTREKHLPFDEDSLRGTEVVKADKGLSLVDGSDEEQYSIIPKGIQLRLTSEDAGERAASILALSRLNTDEAFNEICLAFDDSSEEVRNAAARALYDLNEDRADSFTRALRESPLERRRQIGAALAGSGLAEEAVGNLTGESRDKTYDAFSLLFLMAKAGEVAPLIRAIESHHDNEVRLAVVKLLALSGQQEILPAFRRLAVRGSLPTEVRSAVMEAIYQISSQPQNATPAT